MKEKNQIVHVTILIMGVVVGGCGVKVELEWWMCFVIGMIASFLTDIIGKLEK